MYRRSTWNGIELMQKSKNFLFTRNNHSLLNGIELLYLTKYNITCKFH